MSLLSAPLAAGDLRGTVYTFEMPGDAIPMHSHGAGGSHVTIVARGRVAIHGPTIGRAEYAAGAVIDVADHHEHEITALESNSRVINIDKKMAAK